MPAGVAPRRVLIVVTPATEARQPIAVALARRARACGRFDAAELAVVAEPEALRRRVAAFGPDLLLAAGGDGTVNLALTAVRDGIGLAVVPLGLANDLARSLGRSRAHSLDRSLVGSRDRDELGSLILTSAQRRDLLRFDGHPVLTTGGLGLPAEVVRRLDRLRAGPAAERIAGLGARIYPLLATELCLRGPPLYRFDLAWTEPDGRTRVQIGVPSHGLFVCNQPRFAGVMTLAPAADPSDGQFDLAILHARGRRGLLRLLGALALGEPPAGGVERVSAVEATIRCDRPVRWFGDGELLGKGTRLRVTLEAGGVVVWS